MNISRYIGRAWNNETFNCWTLVRSVYQNELSVTLPEIPIDAENLKQVLHSFKDPVNLSPWLPIAQPENLCLVFFTPGNHHATHCGVWLDKYGGRFLHCHRIAGVVLDDAMTLEMNGWKNPTYYRYEKSSLD